MGGFFACAVLIAFVLLLMWAGSIFPDCFRDEAICLNLSIQGPAMAKIGDTVTARIAPTNISGSFAPVFGASYGDDSAFWDVISTAPDGLSAILQAVAAGTGASVRVDAVSKGGVPLFEIAALPDVDAPPVDEEAVALNLSVA
jgi:hypothetical protein